MRVWMARAKEASQVESPILSPFGYTVPLSISAGSGSVGSEIEESRREAQGDWREPKRVEGRRSPRVSQSRQTL